MMSDQDPERTPVQERRLGLYREMMDLMRRMILEGSVDPSKGTSFTLIQHDILDPEAENGSKIVSVGIPNPLTHGFDQIVNNPNMKGEEE